MTSNAHRWEDLPTDRPMPGITRHRMMGEKMMLSVIHLDAGTVVPTHEHENEQFACVVRGRMRFGLGAEGSAERREVEVEAGGVVHMPAHLPHSAEALEDSEVLDCFSPPSERTGVDDAG